MERKNGIEQEKTEIENLEDIELEVVGGGVKNENGEDGVNKEVKVEAKEENKSQRKTLIELLVVGAPILNFFSIIPAGLYFLSLDIPILLISVFPAQSRNVMTILFCLTFDTLSLLTLLSWAVYTLFIIVSFVLTFKDSVDLAIQKMSRY